MRSLVECSDAARMPHCKDPLCELPHVVLTGTAALRGGGWGVGGNADALRAHVLACFVHPCVGIMATGPQCGPAALSRLKCSVLCLTTAAYRTERKSQGSVERGTPSRPRSPERGRTVGWKSRAMILSLRSRSPVPPASQQRLPASRIRALRSSAVTRRGCPTARIHSVSCRTSF